MSTQKLLKFINARIFFPKFAPSVTNWRHKMRGQNSYGKVIDFTDVDKAAIKAGMKKMIVTFYPEEKPGQIQQ